MKASLVKPGLDNICKQAPANDQPSNKEQQFKTWSELHIASSKLNLELFPTQMPTLYTEIEIEAPRRSVWQALIQKEQWKYWNTFLYDCSPQQSFQQGQRILLSLRRLPGEEETEFEPIVTLVQPGLSLKWVSSIPGFVSEQVFELQEIGRNRTQYIHQEIFSGMLTRIIFPFIRQDEHQGIKRMAHELKRYVERR